MQLYSAKVRLGGSLYNEVIKDDLTAAEITLMRVIHGGDDSVVEIKPTRNDARSDTEERARLQQIYGRALAGIENVKTLNAVLGVPGVPLPQVVPGFEPAIPANARRVRRSDPAPGPEPESVGDDNPAAFE